MPTAFDTETSLICPGEQAPRLACITWASTPDNANIEHATAAKKVARTLLQGASKEHPLVGHNLAFDMCVLARNFPELLPLIFEAYERGAIADTLIREKLVHIALGHMPRGHSPYSLATLSKQYLDIELEKDEWRLKYGELLEIPLIAWPQGAIDYALKDADSTLKVYAAQAANYNSIYFKNEQAQCQADFALRLTSNRGMITCGIKAKKLAEQWKEDLEKNKNTLLDSGLLKVSKRKGIEYISRDTKKAAELVEKHISNPERTPSGKIKLDERACEESGDKLLQAYSQYSKLQTSLSKDATVLQQGAKEPIHTFFNVLVNSGRTSSRSPNIQNPPRHPGVRECYVPRPGFVYAAADYTAAELHTLAQVCLHLFGSSRLANALNEGLDPHLSFAAKLSHIDYDEAVKLKSANNKKILELRQMAKAANFGFPGGMGAKSFREYASNYGLDLTEAQCLRLKKEWLASFPEMRKYFEHIAQRIPHGCYGQITQLYTGRIRGGVTFTAGCNSLFQGLAADGAKAALFQVQNACLLNPDSPLYGSYPVNFVHDEIIIESPEDRASEAAKELSKIMAVEFNKYVPDVPVHASPVLMRCWSKNAIPLYDDSNNLIPWEEV